MIDYLVPVYVQNYINKVMFGKLVHRLEQERTEHISLVLHLMHFKSKTDHAGRENKILVPLNIYIGKTKN